MLCGRHTRRNMFLRHVCWFICYITMRKVKQRLRYYVQQTGNSPLITDCTSSLMKHFVVVYFPCIHYCLKDVVCFFSHWSQEMPWVFSLIPRVTVSYFLTNPISYREFFVLFLWFMLSFSHWSQDLRAFFLIGPFVFSIGYVIIKKYGHYFNSH